MRKPYTHQPEAVYQLGKKKERATKALRKLGAVMLDTNNETIQRLGPEMMQALIDYRKSLDEV